MATSKRESAKMPTKTKVRPPTKAPEKSPAKPMASGSRSAAASAERAARAAEKAVASLQKALEALQRALQAGTRPPPSAPIAEPTPPALQPVQCKVDSNGNVFFVLADGTSVSLDDVLERTVLLEVHFKDLAAAQRTNLKVQLTSLFTFLAKDQAIQSAIGMLAVCRLDRRR